MSAGSNRLLFWDTNYKGEVSLSKSPQALRRKVRIYYLLGGQLLVRPAELFEGDLMFSSAASVDGDLYSLMKVGQAKLALPRNQTLHERAQWRFGDGKTSKKHLVVHQGRHIAEKSEIEKIKKETFFRTERLLQVGWPSADSNVFSNEDLAEQTKIFLQCLEMIGRRYFWLRFERTSLGRFVEEFEGKDIASRSDLFPTIERVWSKDVRATDRESFIRDCKEALTVASALFAASNIGANVSEIRPQTFESYCLGAYENKSRFFSDTTVRIVKALAESLREGMIGEDWDQSFVKSWLEIKADRFAELSAQYITIDDRNGLYELMYKPSNIDEFEGCSLVEKIMKAEKKPHHQEIKRLAILRLKELQNRMNNDAKGLSWLVNCVCFFMGIFLHPVIPAAKRIWDGCAILRLKEASHDVVLAGLRKSVSNK